MPEVIALANQKGGVGKTTTAINLAAALAHLGHETLLIDLDPQGNATSGLGFERTNTPNTGIYSVLVNSVPLSSCLFPTEIELLDIACSNFDMVSAELELMPLVSRENRLREAIKTVLHVYSFILIDCPPSLGLLTINALSAADKVLIPIQGEYYALEGLSQLLKTVELVRGGLNTDLQVLGVLLTMYDRRNQLSNQVLNEVSKNFPGRVFNAVIPRTVSLAESPSFGKTILQFDPDSKAARAYRQLAEEVIRLN